MKVEIYRDGNGAELQLNLDGITMDSEHTINAYYELDDNDIYNLIRDLKLMVTKRKLNNKWTLGSLGDNFNELTDKG